MISNPVPRFATGPATAPNALESPSVVYVSLAPHIVRTAVSATIRVRGTNFTITEAMLDGALDPTPVPAKVGDTVDVTVTDRAHATRNFVMVVPARRKPTVVRTVPPKGKTDVPLNRAIKVVFSEPIDPLTLGSGAVELRHGNSVIEGYVEVEPSERLSVVFAPAAQLLPNARHQLVVSRTVRDVDGEELDRALTVDFTTGTHVESTGPAVSLTVSPDPAVAMPFQSVRFTAIVRDAAGHVLSGHAVTWESSNDNVARIHVPGGDTIPINGLVVATGLGTATITATTEGISGSSTMTVQSTPVEGTEVASVRVTLTSSGLWVDDTRALLVMPYDVNGAEIPWAPTIYLTSDNPAVAIVPAVRFPPCWSDPPGRVSCLGQNYTWVRGVGEGSTRVTATIEGVSGSTTITVGPRRVVTTLKVSPQSATLLPGIPANLPYELILRTRMWDANGAEIEYWQSGRQVTWTIANPEVVRLATQQADGHPGGTMRATVVGPGSTVVTATSEGIRSSMTITVPSLKFVSISAGDYADGGPDYRAGHTCGLIEGGVTYCWGGDHGTPGDSWDHWSYFPVPLDGGLTFSSITAGRWHTCGLTAAGQAYCWSNFIYWSDDNWGGSAETPSAVTGGVGFASLDAGGYHNCGLTAVGSAYCWGYNAHGQLGAGDLVERTGPVNVSGGHTFVDLTAGNEHSCGLTAAGAAYCWGMNNAGQLGDGSTTDRWTPVLVGGGHTFASLEAGFAHTCALTTTGAAYCWGSGASGELGHGAVGARILPTAVSGGITFVALTAGAAGPSTCGLTSAGAAHCWGSNSSGQIGDGSNINRLMPVAVAGGHVFASVSAGGEHTCAVTTASVAYCWGASTAGRLGGVAGDNKLPVKVLGQP